MENVFGREEQASIDLLLTYIYNNISLGQWELAFACIKEYHRRQKKSTTTIIDLLRSLSKNCEDVCNSSQDNWENAQLFSWLCANQLLNLVIHEDHVVLKCEAEFRLLLTANGEVLKIGEEKLSELYAFFKWTCSKRNYSVPLPLSPELQQLLKEWLNINPKFGSEVLNILTVDQKRSEENNKIIENLYIETIRDCLKQSQRGADDDETKLYRLIQLYKPELSSEKFNNLIPELVLTSDVERIYNYLLGKDAILKPFHDYIVNLKIDDKFQDVDLTNDEAFIYEILTKPSIEPNDWLSLFHRIIQRKFHVIDILLNTTKKLFSSKREKDLTRLFKSPLFIPLLPVTFCFLWQDCNSLKDGKTLLESIEDMDLNNIRFSQVFTKLNNHIRLSEKTYQLTMKFDDSIEIENKIFQLLKEYSVLGALKECFELGALEEDDILYVLNHAYSIDDNDVWEAEKNDDIATYIIYLIMNKVLEALELCKDDISEIDYTEVIWRRLRSAVEYFKQLNIHKKVYVLFNIFKLLFIRANTADCWSPNLTSTPRSSVENLDEQDSITSDISNKESDEIFIINELLMRDFLSILKECLALVNMEKSYFDEELERNVANLSHFISEATWRFELVGRKEIVLSSIGTKPVTNMGKGIISKMLASPESLAAMCMLNKEVYKTEQVIKLYNLEDSYLEQEFEFSKKYAKTMKSINDVSRPTNFACESNQEVDPLCEIKKLARKGLHVLEVTQPLVELIENFPPSLFNNQTSSPLDNENIIHPAILNALVALDIAIVAGNCKKNSIILLQHAQRILASRHQSDGNDNWLTEKFPRILQLSKLIEKRLEADSDLTQTSRSLLCQCLSPIDAENFEKYSKFEQVLSDCIERIENALKSYSKMQTKLLIEQAKKTRDEDAEIISLEPVITKSMENLVDCLQSFDFIKDGIFSIFCKEFESSGEFRDYLGSLLTHVKELKLLTKGDITDQKGIEYFTVLDEMPTQILGRLIFNEQIAPLKLATVANKLNVNLTRVLVNNCCPFVPSKFELPKKTLARIIFDSNYENKRLEDRTSTIVKDCLFQIIQLMKKDNKEYHDLSSLHEFSKSNEIWKILERTKILKYSQLIFYDKDDEIAFWINLHNLLIFESILFELKNCDSIKSFEDTPLKREIFDYLYSYALPKYGILSLAEMRMILNSLKKKSHYALLNGKLSGPAAAVFSGNMIRNHIRTFIEEYLDTSIQVNSSNRVMKIPDVLYEMIDDIEEFIKKHSSKLKVLFDDPKTKKKQSSWTFETYQLSREVGIKFTFDVCQNKSSERRWSSLPNINENSWEGSTGEPSTSPKYALTPPILEYLKQSSSVVPTLVSLLCSDDLDDIQYDMDESYFGNVSSEELGRNEDDLRRYRYRTLIGEFDILERFLLVHSAPLIVHTLSNDQSSDVIQCITRMNMTENVRKSFLSSNLSNDYIEVVDYVLNNALRKEKYAQVVRIIDELSPLTIQRRSHYKTVKDACLIKLLQKSNETESARIFKQINDKDLRSRKFIKEIDKFNDPRIILNIIKWIGEDSSFSNEFRNTFQLYSDIMECSKNYENWKDIEKDCIDNDEDILCLLLNAEKITSAYNFASLFNLSKELRMKIDVKQMEIIMREDRLWELSASQHLTSIFERDQAVCENVCYYFIENLDNKEHAAFVINFLIDFFKDDLSEIVLERLQKTLEGCQMDWIETILKSTNWSPEQIRICDQLLIDYAGKSLTIPNTDSCSESESIISGAYSRRTRVEDSSTRSPSFTIPSVAPSIDQWIPDSATTVCMICNARFTMFVRRHHCRRCGRVICSTCSSKRMKLGDGEELVRVCDDCAELLSNDPVKVEICDNISDFAPNMYKLSINELENEMLRKKFQYEFAPSSSLCITILKLVQNKQQSVKTLVELAKNVSQMLRPLKNGQRNPEIDYSFVIDVIKSLLFEAKVQQNTLEIPIGNDIELHLTSFDLLNSLVLSNCPIIPSLHQLVGPKQVSSFRDDLVKKERFVSALEVSGKFGLDSNLVWLSWGLANIVGGFLEEARNKLKKCLKKVTNRAVQSNGIILQQIVENLQKYENRLQLKEAVHLTNWKDLLVDDVKPKNTDSENSRECLFYLTNYGSHSDIIKYFMNMRDVRKAVLYIVEHKCSSQIFVENVLMKANSTGLINNMKKELRSIDSSRWSQYITESCKYCQQQRMFNLLYDLQIFIKDHIRAAMTCSSCLFTQTPPDKKLDYGVLYNRLHYLTTAIKHLKDYREQNQSGRSSGSSSLILDMTYQEVKKFSTTITLQIEVTKLFQIYLEKVQQLQKDIQPKTCSTLLGSTRMQSDVVCIILLCGNNINDGFGLAFRIIQELRLDADTIYKRVAEHLCINHKYSEIRQFLSCIKDSGLTSFQSLDSVILACIKNLTKLNTAKDIKEAESLMSDMKTEKLKIDAYIYCGKLKAAYLLAVKLNQLQDILEIAKIAEKTGQVSVKNICEEYLKKKGITRPSSHDN
ncbi:DgyrCDS7665 [Dimorphilus gyrociliatus]|uniref:DgyrCDS7665 n=1 Tax=Dimorphilus gyrociliatus TaxID=2664684 RepID=A0A7I8VRW1_9ANNE|nr:DgyrCDS7665 [Dimorphilus gyrociliatus]